MDFVTCPYCGSDQIPSSFLERHIQMIHKGKRPEGWRDIAEVSEGPANVESGSEFRRLEPLIDEILRKRGFAPGNQHPDCTVWDPSSDFWEEEAPFSWCLAQFQDGGLYFGVSRSFVVAALRETLNSEGDLKDLWLKAMKRGLPGPIRKIGWSFTRQGDPYLAIRIVKGIGIEEIRALVVELVNSFIIFATGGKPWDSTKDSERSVAELGVACLQMVERPDHELTPHHSLSLMADEITRSLPQSFSTVPAKGSIGWKNAATGKVELKLCYFGRDWWLFGVNRDVVQANPCLQGIVFNLTFHIMPISLNSRPVYLGFQVFDTPASESRLRQVLNCFHPHRG